MKFYCLLVDNYLERGRFIMKINHIQTKDFIRIFKTFGFAYSAKTGGCLPASYSPQSIQKLGSVYLYGLKDGQKVCFTDAVSFKQALDLTELSLDVSLFSSDELAR